MKIPYWKIIAIPLLLIFSGAASNQAVLVANWGKFPVMVNHRVEQKLKARNAVPDFSIFRTAVPQNKKADTDLMIDDIHCVMTPQSRLKVLADWINLQTDIMSPGDLLIMLGEFLWQFALIAWIVLVIKKFNDGVVA
jgi:hypothetical protein